MAGAGMFLVLGIVVAAAYFVIPKVSASSRRDNTNPETKNVFVDKVDAIIPVSHQQEQFLTPVLLDEIRKIKVCFEFIIFI